RASRASAASEALTPAPAAASSCGGDWISQSRTLSWGTGGSGASPSSSTALRGRWLGGELAARPLPAEGGRRGDEVPEERVRPGRPALELGVELRRAEPGVVGQLDRLHEPAVERAAAGHE